MATMPTLNNRPSGPSGPGTTVSRALTPKKANLVGYLLLTMGLLVAIGLAAYGYLESRRTETVVLAVRDIPFGHQLVAEDLTTIEVPLHRSARLTGMPRTDLVIGQYAARAIGTNDLFQAPMLMPAPPDKPIFPNGAELPQHMVSLALPTTLVGPVRDLDLLNVGFNDPSGDPALCNALGGAGVAAPSKVEPVLDDATGTERPKGRAYACRLIERIDVLYVDAEAGVAYLAVSPYQSIAIQSLKAQADAGLVLWSELYGTTSEPLQALDKLDASEIDLGLLTAPVPTPAPTPAAAAQPEGAAAQPAPAAPATK